MKKRRTLTQRKEGRKASVWFCFECVPVGVGEKLRREEIGVVVRSFNCHERVGHVVTLCGTSRFCALSLRLWFSLYFLRMQMGGERRDEKKKGARQRACSLRWRVPGRLNE